MHAETIGPLLLVGIAIISMVSIILLPSLAPGRVDSGADALVRLTGVAAVCAGLSALMYVAHAAEPTPVVLAMGDATMTLAPAMLWAAMSAVNGRYRWVVSLAAVAAVVVAVFSLAAPDWVSSGVKTLLLAASSFAVFVVSRRGRAHRTLGSAIVGSVCLVYAIYCVLRIGGGFTISHTAQFVTYFGTNTASAVGGLTILGSAAGVVVMRVNLAPRRRVGATAAHAAQLARAMVAQGQDLTAFTVRLTDITLIRRAFGREAAQRMTEAGAAAVDQVVPGSLLTASPDGTAIVALTVGRRRSGAIKRRIAEAYAARAPHLEGVDAGQVVTTRTTVRTDADVTRALDAVSRRTLLREGRPLHTSTYGSRALWINQLLLAASIVVISVAIVFSQPQTFRSVPFAVGTAAILFVTAAMVAVPWNRIPRDWLVVVPLIDIVAIGALSLENDLRLGFLWAFPVIWIAMAFSTTALVGALAMVAGALGASAAVDTADSALLRTTVVLVCIVFIGVTTHIAAQQNEAFRSLLSAQATRMRESSQRAESEGRHAAELLNAVDIGIARIGPEGTLLVVNDTLAAFYGYDRDDLAQPPRSIDYDDRVGNPILERERPLARAARGQEFSDVVVWLFSAAGDWRALSITSTRLPGQGSSGTELLVTARDVTAVVSAQREREQFTAMATHEMRHPLTAILGNAELSLDGGALPESERRRMEIIHESSERLIDLISDFIAGKRSSQQPSAQGESAFDLRLVIGQSVESFRVNAASRGVAIDISLDEALPIRADAFRIRQVVDNLISNAVKYTREEGSVTVRGRREGDRVIVTIADTGIGMSPEEVRSVFDPYFRAEAARETAAGTGLGMNITREILQQHGGHVSLDSRKDVGTVVMMELPAVDAAARS